MSMSISDRNVKYAESFRVHGFANLSAQTSSLDSKLIKEIEKQKQLLKQAGLSTAFMGEEGAEELENISQVTRSMRSFWQSMSSTNLSFLSMQSPWSASRIDTNSSARYLDDTGDIAAEFVVQDGSDGQVRPLNMSGDSGLHIYKGLRGLSEVESEAIKTSAPRMKEFWQKVKAEKQHVGSSNSKIKSAELQCEDVTFSVDVGIDENFNDVSSQSIEGFAHALSFNSLQSPKQSQLW